MDEKLLDEIMKKHASEFNYALHNIGLAITLAANECIYEDKLVEYKDKETLKHEIFMRLLDQIKF